MDPSFTIPRRHVQLVILLSGAFADPARWRVHCYMPCHAPCVHSGSKLCYALGGASRPAYVAQVRVAGCIMFAAPLQSLHDCGRHGCWRHNMESATAQCWCRLPCRSSWSLHSAVKLTAIDLASGGNGCHACAGSMDVQETFATTTSAEIMSTVAGEELLTTKDLESAEESTTAKTSAREALFNCVNILLGCGVLSIPYALQEGGWAAFAVLGLMWVSTNYTGKVLIQCQEYYSRNPNQLPAPGSSIKVREGLMSSCAPSIDSHILAVLVARSQCFWLVLSLVHVRLPGGLYMCDTIACLVLGCRWTLFRSKSSASTA
jgi:Transmembrane amino acid transporter protein